jgi:SHS2 domain-containing protein
MKHFELIEHTADVGVEASGADLREAFEAAAEGMFSIIAETESVKPTETYQVEADADDAEALLVEWLNELLYLFDAKNVLLCRFSVTSLTPIRLEADVFGEKYDPSRHRINMAVKAATYHAVSVEEDDAGARVRVILDV